MLPSGKNGPHLFYQMHASNQESHLIKLKDQETHSKTIKHVYRKLSVLMQRQPLPVQGSNVYAMKYIRI